MAGKEGAHTVQRQRERACGSRVTPDATIQLVVSDKWKYFVRSLNIELTFLFFPSSSTFLPNFALHNQKPAG
jgi:hypothetical protein